MSNSQGPGPRAQGPGEGQTSAASDAIEARAELRGRTIVLTGAGRVGQVADLLGRDFAERGARVVLLGRDAKEVEARAAELRASGATAFAFACDLTDVAGTAAAVKRAEQDTKGEVHALVNLAGGFGANGPVAESKPEEFAQQIAISLTTAYVASRAFLPMLRRSRGSIVFFSSVAALPGSKAAGLSGYVAAKSGVIGLMRAVSQEETSNGVRANALAPSSIRTAANVAAMGKDASYVEAADLANIVAFLCSPASAAVTGQVIEAKGTRS